MLWEDEKSSSLGPFRKARMASRAVLFMFNISGRVVSQLKEAIARASLDSVDYVLLIGTLLPPIEAAQKYPADIITHSDF